MATKRIRLGIAGLRHRHIETIIDEARRRPDVELTAIAEPEETVRREYQSTLDVPAFADHREMYAAGNLDAVGVGAINADRGGIVVDALTAGLQVVADKPLCTTLADLAAIETAWQGSDRLLSVAFEKRFYPPTLALQEILAAGELGDPVLVAASAPHKLNKPGRAAWMFEHRSYGGIINDLAIHDIDLFLHFTGAQRGVVQGYAGNRGNADRPEFTDHGLAVIRTDDGLLGTFEVHWMSPEAADYHGDYRMRWVGTQGTAELLWKDDQLSVATHSRPPRLVPLPPRRRPAEDFFDALLADREPQITAAQSIAATRVTLLAQLSADEETPKSWDISEGLT